MKQGQPPMPQAAAAAARQLAAQLPLVATAAPPVVPAMARLVRRLTLQALQQAGLAAPPRPAAARAAGLPAPQVCCPQLPHAGPAAATEPALRPEQRPLSGRLAEAALGPAATVYLLRAAAQGARRKAAAAAEEAPPLLPARSKLPRLPPARAARLLLVVACRQALLPVLLQGLLLLLGLGLGPSVLHRLLPLHFLAPCYQGMPAPLPLVVPATPPQAARLPCPLPPAVLLVPPLLLWLPGRPQLWRWQAGSLLHRQLRRRRVMRAGKSWS